MLVVCGGLLNTDPEYLTWQEVLLDSNAPVAMEWQGSQDVRHISVDMGLYLTSVDSGQSFTAACVSS